MSGWLPWTRGVLFQGTIYGLMGLMGLFGAPVVLWSRRLTYRWASLYVRIVFALARAICGLRTEIRGTPPDGDVIVAAKHQSMLDVFMLFAALPHARFIMKRELTWVPVFGLYALRIGCIPVNRSERGAGDRMLEALAEGGGPRGQVVIYPQGTRVAPGVKFRYKRGAVRAYTRFGLPLVLVATNTGVFWPRRGWAIHPGAAVVEFGETLPPGLPPNEATRRIEELVERESERLEDEGFASLGITRPARRGRGAAESPPEA